MVPRESRSEAEPWSTYRLLALAYGPLTLVVKFRPRKAIGWIARPSSPATRARFKRAPGRLFVPEWLFRPALTHWLIGSSPGRTWCSSVRSRRRSAVDRRPRWMRRGTGDRSSQRRRPYGQMRTKDCCPGLEIMTTDGQDRDRRSGRVRGLCRLRGAQRHSTDELTQPGIGSRPTGIDISRHRGVSRLSADCARACIGEGRPRGSGPPQRRLPRFSEGGGNNALSHVRTLHRAGSHRSAPSTPPERRLPPQAMIAGRVEALMLGDGTCGAVTCKNHGQAAYRC